MPVGQVGLVEIKSGQTYHGDFANPMNRVAAVLTQKVARRMVVYGGDESYTRDGVDVVGVL